MDWQRLADAVISRRVELGMKTQQALVEATGLTRRLLTDIEHARRDNYDPATLARIEQSLRWLPGSVQAILNGGEPTPMPEQGAAVLVEGASDALAFMALLAASGLPQDSLERIIVYIRSRQAEQHKHLLAEVRRLIAVESGDLPGETPFPEPRRGDRSGDDVPYGHLST